MAGHHPGGTLRAVLHHLRKLCVIAPNREEHFRDVLRLLQHLKLRRLLGVDAAVVLGVRPVEVGDNRPGAGREHEPVLRAQLSRKQRAIGRGRTVAAVAFVIRPRQVAVLARHRVEPLRPLPARVRIAVDDDCLGCRGEPLEPVNAPEVVRGVDVAVHAQREVPGAVGDHGEGRDGAIRRHAPHRTVAAARDQNRAIRQHLEPRGAQDAGFRSLAAVAPRNFRA